MSIRSIAGAAPTVAAISPPSRISSGKAPTAAPTPAAAQLTTSHPVNQAAAKALSAAAAALKEATESSAQTAKEAAGGDRVAQRLLAKEAAAKATIAGQSSTKGARVNVKA